MQTLTACHINANRTALRRYDSDMNMPGSFQQSFTGDITTHYSSLCSLTTLLASRVAPHRLSVRLCRLPSERDERQWLQCPSVHSFGYICICLITPSLLYLPCPRDPTSELNKVPTLLNLELNMYSTDSVAETPFLEFLSAFNFEDVPAVWIPLAGAVMTSSHESRFMRLPGGKGLIATCILGVPADQEM